LLSDHLFILFIIETFLYYEGIQHPRHSFMREKI
jgi:hypothetical protein